MLDHNLVLFVTTATLVCASPGPSTLLILAHSASRDLQRPAMLILGALSANIMMITLVAFGFDTVSNIAPNTLFWFKLAGGVFLIGLGGSYLWPKATTSEPSPNVQKKHTNLMIQAFLTSATNPKAILFYAALLPAFATPGPSFGFQIMSYGALYVLIFVACLIAYALVGYSLGAVAPSAFFMRLKDKALGCFLIATGIAMLRWSHTR